MKRKKEIFDLSTVSFNNLIEAGDEVEKKEKIDVIMICREQKLKFKLIPCTQ